MGMVLAIVAALADLQQWGWCRRALPAWMWGHAVPPVGQPLVHLPAPLRRALMQAALHAAVRTCAAAASRTQCKISRGRAPSSSPPALMSLHAANMPGSELVRGRLPVPAAHPSPAQTGGWCLP